MTLARIRDGKFRNSLAKMTSLTETSDLLAKTEAISKYKAKLDKDGEEARTLAEQVLEIKAKIGELLPARPPEDRGQGRGGKKSTGVTPVDFDDHTISAYRKLARHQADLEPYFDSTEDIPSQIGFLKYIQEQQRTTKEAEREASREENRQKIAQVEDPIAAGITFSTILIDPPWDWGDEGDCDQLGRAKPDYATMSLEQLLALPVGSLADDNSHIYLWITNRSLPKGFQLLEAWGFRYVTALTWPKTHFGMGNYFRGQTEHILFGVRGSQMLSRKDASTLLPSWKRGDRHSAKPQEIYEFVESCSPGPYLEMFSRSERDGWVRWGENS